MEVKLSALFLQSCGIGTNRSVSKQTYVGHTLWA